jgi:hypothetical protein
MSTALKTKGFYDEMLPMLKHLEYTDPKTTDEGGMINFVNASAGSKQSHFFQAAKFGEKYPECPFGVSAPIKHKGPRETYVGTKATFDLSIEEPGLLKYLRALDEANLDYMTKNADKWFKDKFGKTLEGIEKKSKKTQDEIYATVRRSMEAFYKPCVIPAKEGYSPTFRTKVNINGPRNAVFDLYDQIEKGGKTIFRPQPKGKSVSWMKVPAHAKVLPLVKIQGLWKVGNEFGVTFLLTEGMIIPGGAATGGGIVLPADVEIEEALADADGAEGAGAGAGASRKRGADGPADEEPDAKRAPPSPSFTASAYGSGALATPMTSGGSAFPVAPVGAA